MLAPESEQTIWFRALHRALLSTLRQSHVDGDASARSAQLEWRRREGQVQNLVMAAADAGDRSNLVALLQSGLPFPKSPSQQELVQVASERFRLSQMKESTLDAAENLHVDCKGNRVPVVGDNVLDDLEEDGEERRWWSLRLNEIRGERESDAELNSLVEHREAQSFEATIQHPDNRPAHRTRSKVRYIRR
jgi:hypothetical protein